MVLIVDSGSSKTQWFLRHDNGATVQRRTMGLHPRFTTDGVFHRCLREVLGDTVFSGDIFFYGAGCGTDESKERYRQLFIHHCPEAHVHIEDDMTGACRALLGNEAGMVGILGTGSNACRYNGHRITERTVSTGYILGDEGSGNHIGRRLWKDFWAGKMPKPLATAFQEHQQLSLAEFLTKLYQQPNANRFLATAAPFAAQHRTDDYVHRLLIGCMTDYLTEQVIPLFHEDKEKRLALVGSVAAGFREELEETAKESGIVITQVMADPMDGLVEYHNREGVNG